MFPWEMDVDGESSGTLGQMEDLEKFSSENESCGICRDIIIDRGVLDCCSHWFCYTCIDNWAAITNRCPLCKSEFQHITCTPVYGTIGAADEDEYSLTSCDDDWYAQEESSTLSFPSYYIDAEAVVCLDDGDCKIRNGLVAAEDDSTLDTSIACDSCDKWYHAICVGFNPAMASDNSWLCPRCKFNEVEHEADVILKQNFSEECVIGSDRTGTNASFSGRMSVSVADEGETALVVSMVGVHSETRGGLSEASLGLKTAHETFNCSSYPSHSKDARVADASSLWNADIFSRSQNKPSEINVVHTLYSEPTETSLQFSPIREPAATFSSEEGNMSTERLEVPKLVSSCPLVDNSKEAKSTGEENAVEQSNNELSPVIKSPQPFSSDAVQQMKTAQNLQLPLRHDGHYSDDMKEEEDMASGNEVIHPAKKAKLEVQEQDINVIGNSGFSSTHSHHTTSPAKATDDDMSDSVAQQKSIPDIMSIVEGDVYRRDPGRELAKPVGRRAGDKAGPRVKKIFRKEEGKESSALVQKLQKEIREVVRDTGTNILEKDGSFDEKLLTAFRAAIGKSVDGPAKSTNTNQLMRTRRSLLQKGKKRENLTKKLYGASTGRRRSDWHRDWEVEFWKYRCSPGINPEKIETLQSVLQLLKKSSEMDKESAKGKKEANNNNSILSRLYLADASVVPRKDDIRPLSALAGCAPLDKSSQIKANGNKSSNIPAAGTETMKISSPSSTGKASSSSILNKEASSRSENRNSQPSQDKRNRSSGDIKQDKRKWALEILARKNASSVTSKEQTGGTDTLKGNFPLLAQLPMDMRPQLAAGSNKKVPVSVRQAQLHRIAEHYLQKANLDVVRRCADTELAIADAVNVEKGIYERSNSKSIYVNLCSQATRQHAKAKSDNDTSSLTKRIESGSDQISQEVTSEDTNVSGSDMEEAQNRAAVSDQKIELGGDTAPGHTVHKDTVSFSSAEDALRKAGLFDSPPNSPDRGTTEVEGQSRLEEPSKNLQSYPEDVSSLKDDNSSLPTDLDAANCQSLDTMSQQPERNSEEQQKLTSKGETEDVAAKKINATNLTEVDRCSEKCEKSSGPGKEISVDCNMPDKVPGHVEALREMEKTASTSPNQSREDGLTTDGEVISKPKNLEPPKEKSCSDKPSVNSKDPKADKPKHAAEGGDDLKKQAPDQAGKNTPDASNSTYKKVEIFVKEQIRPLCKSGVITVDQYKWAVVKTTDKVMSFHRDAKNANFLIKEGDKVKKLALQYVEASQQKIS